MTNCATVCENRSYVYGFEECAILSRCTANISGSDREIGFFNCQLVTDCIAAITSRDMAVGFFLCERLSGCTVVSHGSFVANSIFGFRLSIDLVNCTAFVNSSDHFAVGFLLCRNLTTCTGAGHSPTLAEGRGFERCRTGFGCKSGPTPSSGATFHNCLMAQGTGNPTTNDWANTAAGGWNMP